MTRRRSPINTIAPELPGTEPTGPWWCCCEEAEEPTQCWFVLKECPCTPEKCIPNDPDRPRVTCFIKCDDPFLPPGVEVGDHLAHIPDDCCVEVTHRKHYPISRPPATENQCRAELPWLRDNSTFFEIPDCSWEDTNNERRGCCLPDLGACCMCASAPDSCIPDLTQQECLDQPEEHLPIWIQDGECSDCPNTQPCCLDEDCLVEREDCCLDLGGEPRGQPLDDCVGIDCSSGEGDCLGCTEEQCGRGFFITAPALEFDEPCVDCRTQSATVQVDDVCGAFADYFDDESGCYRTIVESSCGGCTCDGICVCPAVEEIEITCNPGEDPQCEPSVDFWRAEVDVGWDADRMTLFYAKGGSCPQGAYTFCSGQTSDRDLEVPPGCPDSGEDCFPAQFGMVMVA